jgi:transglutaminase-like putative cysteine protease
MLTPRNTQNQVCKSSQLSVSPLPEVLDSHYDFFGNKVFYFVVEQEHNTLEVTTQSIIEKTEPDARDVISGISWEEVRDMLAISCGNYVEEKQFTTATGVTTPTEAIKEYALESFPPNKPFFYAAYDLMQRIFKDFKYTSGFTTISTPLSTVLKERKGVCQDFAHLALACLHAMGLPGRYVSGYLETMPPPGQVKLEGADASHAWFSVYIPGMGWVDFDPTNQQIPNEQYITVAWGRDYFDVVPLKGVIMSSSHHDLKVSVDVRRLP